MTPPAKALGAVLVAIMVALPWYLYLMKAGVESSNHLAPTSFLKENPAFSAISKPVSLEVLGNAGFY